MEEKSVRRTAPEYVQLSFDDVVSIFTLYTYITADNAI